MSGDVGTCAVGFRCRLVDGGWGDWRADVEAEDATAGRAAFAETGYGPEGSGLYDSGSCKGGGEEGGEVKDGSGGLHYDGGRMFGMELI